MPLLEKLQRAESLRGASQKTQSAEIERFGAFIFTEIF